ncbi:MAG: hypothetical protein IJ658_08570 [Kiritimatiellae bacterium]|nr:hypothetical protein [Kiritimatiellia bacterium]
MGRDRLDAAEHSREGTGEDAEGRELVDWCVDQFVVWSDPIHNMDWPHWKTPAAAQAYCSFMDSSPLRPTWRRTSSVLR